MNRRKLIVTVLTIVSVLAVSALAFAQQDPETAKAVAKSEAGKWIAIAAGLGMAIAAFGGALGQGRTASMFLEGVARNPGARDKMFVPMIIGLALIESLVIYSLLISFALLDKI